MTDNTERDELARELFIGDNFNQSREGCIADWDYLHTDNALQVQAHHYKVMASAALAAGFRRPRTITTQEELDAAPIGAVIRDAGDWVLEKATKSTWFNPGDEIAANTAQLPAVVLWEPEV